MPLSLTDLATHKPVKTMTRPTPAFERVDDGGRVLAAVLAPAPPGWVVVPFDDRVVVAVNGGRVGGPALLSAGDELVLGRKQFEVVAVDGPDDAASPPGSAAPTCEVTARFRGGEVGRATVARPLAVGTDPACGLVLPAETGLAPIHAVLAHVDGHWVLLAFHDGGATRFGGGPPDPCLALVSDESVWLGDVELTALFEEVDLLDQAYPDVMPAPPPRSAGSPDPEWAETQIFGGQAETPPASPSRGSSTPFWVRASAAGEGSGPLQARVLDLCRWLQGEHNRGRPHDRPAEVTREPFDGPSQHCTGSVTALDRFTEPLRAAPWDPDALFDLADYLWQLGLSDSSRWVLKQLYRQNPRDVVVVTSLAVVSHEQSRDEARPADERLADARRAHKYATAATRLRPADRRLQDLHREIASEMTLREMARHGPAARRPDGPRA